MFSFLYSNWIYFIILLYSPKNYNKFEDNLTNFDKNQIIIKSDKSCLNPRYGKSMDTNRIENFIRNSVQNLIHRLKTISDNSSELEVSINSRISVRHLNILRQYLPQNYHYLNCEQLEEFEDSINEFIQSMVTVIDYNENSLKSLIFNPNFNSNILKLFLYLIIFLLIILSLKQLFDIFFRRQTLFEYKIFLSKKSLLILTLISLTLISILWKWRQKYLIELSRKQCYVLATPEECLNRHSELTFISWIRNYMYSYEQRRHDYYRAVTVDPFWEINPSTVISELLSEMVFTPLKPLGEYSGLFIASLFKGIPLYLVVPVFIFLCFCTLLLVLLIAVWLLMPNRYSIKIPFLMTIQFDRNHPKGITHHKNHSLAFDEQNIVRKYQIRANVVNVYNTIATNKTQNNSDNNFSENQIKFDENLTFITENPISIPYSEVD